MAMATYVGQNSKNALGGDLVWEGLWPARKGTEGCTVDIKS